VSIDVYIGGSIREIVPYTLSLSATLGNRATFGCRVVSTSGAYRPQQGQLVEIWTGGTKLWAGSIDEVSEVSITEAGAAPGAYYEISGITWEQRLDRRRCFNPSTALPAHYDGSFVYTADASTNTLTTASAHGRVNGDKVRVKAHAQGAICGGLSGTTEYFVVNAGATTLQLSLSSGGGAVDITDTGTLDQVLVTGRAGLIVKDLITNFASNEGIGSTNVDDGVVVDVVTFDASTTVSEAIGQLAALCNFVWWIDEDRELYFKPRTFATAPFSISTSSANYRSLQARRTREDKANATLSRVPPEQVAALVEPFTGNGTARAFTLSRRLGQIVSIRLNDQDVDFGQYLSDTEKAWYWQFGSTQIRQDAGADVLTSADTLTVSYRALGADTITAEDAGDISGTITQEGGGSGRYEAFLERDLGQLQALAEAQQVIAAKKDPVTEISYETDEQVEPLCVTLRPGQIQTIANTPRGVSSSSYLIHDVQVIDVAGLYLRFRVRAITGTSIVGVQEYWRALAGMGGAVSTISGTSGGTNSTSTPTAPDNVTGVTATSEFADETTVRVKLFFTAPSPLGDFIGVHVWEEPVDQSTGGAVPLNSSATLGGTRNLGGTFAPIDRGYHLTSPATIYIPRPTQAETKRFYLASYSETAEAELVRAGNTNATPNVTITVGDTIYQSGEEYARLVTGVSVTVQYDDSQVASPKYRLVFGWTAPASPPAAWQREFGGVQIVYEYADGNRAQGPALAVNETTARSDWYDLFVGSSIIRCWFVSMDASEKPRINTIVSGLTPLANATVTWPLASRPVLTPYADNVTGFTATNARYATNGQGQKSLLIDLAWAQPSGAAALARWGGVVIWLHLPGNEKIQVTGAETGTGLTAEFSAFPQAAATWLFYAVSVDNNANANTDGRNPAVGTPSATIAVSPPSAGTAGTEWTSHVTGASFAAATVAGSDGTTLQRITATFTAPSDVTWGGVELRVYDGATLLSSVAATPSPISVNIPNPAAATTVTAKLVSFDVNNRTNSEVAGTPQNTLNIGSAAGTLDLRKFLPASTDNFQVNGSFLQVKVGTAITIDGTGNLRVAVSGITDSLIATGAVTNTKIDTSAVTETKIATDAVTSPKIIAGAITTAKIAANAVTANEIAAGAIVTAKLAANAVTANEIAANAVIAGKIATNAVTAGTIAANAVTTAKLDATEISVGGGGSKPGKFGVYNASGSQIGFIGVESGNEGGWFKTLSVGGTSFATGKLKADSSGNVTINDATLVLNANGLTTRVSNGADPYSNFAGFFCTSNSTGWFCSVSRNELVFSDGSGSGSSSQNLRIYSGFDGVGPNPGPSIQLRNTSGSVGLTLTAGAITATGAISGGSFSIGATPGVTASSSVLTGLTVSSSTVVSSVGQTTTSINYLDAPASQTVVTNVNTSTTSVVTGVSYSAITLNYLDHSSNPQTETVVQSITTTTDTISEFASQSTVSLTRNSSTLVSNVSSTTTSVGSASGLTSATFGFTGGIRTT
jgi:hypothetical protein